MIFDMQRLISAVPFVPFVFYSRSKWKKNKKLIKARIEKNEISKKGVQETRSKATRVFVNNKKTLLI